ncbi:Eukaryotic aspartyl protease family protein [Perilla frutescens var. hirtella]|nr:Eukaryotic aspartyl protease family protein [Perilla frutescens var. frutescens]KAH6800840.1 Eukaryotic aspartyl protease family protein [Perilla frutescens var. hirtella]
MSSSSSMAVTLLLMMVVVAPPAASSSRDLLDVKTGFQVKLKHVDWGGNFTKLQLLQRGMKRGRKRMERLYAMALATVSAPIHAGNGEFLMELSIGTPPSSYSAILDTGSDLIWTQCKPCKQCFNSPTPIFDPKQSSSFAKLSCSTDLCTALPLSSCSNGNCEYLYTYGDYSSTQGVMATETFTFGKVSVPKVGFGCGLDNEGSGFNQGGGLVGLGRGPLSLVSQLDEPKFSYCLTSIDSAKTSTLSMGSLAGLDAKDTTIMTTPLIKNPSSPSFYYLSLQGITVGDTSVPIKKSSFAIKGDGTGGMIIDSGTTITYLEEKVFDLVKKEFIKQVKLPVDDSNQTGLDLCFTLPSNAESVEVPKLVFHFDGADLDLPGENYIIADASGVACLAMGSSSGMSIFGNIQQQNMQVIHDLHKETISFVPKQCDKM